MAALPGGGSGTFDPIVSGTINMQKSSSFVAPKREERKDIRYYLAENVYSDNNERDSDIETVNSESVDESELLMRQEKVTSSGRRIKPPQNPDTVNRGSKETTHNT